MKPGRMAVIVLAGATLAVLGESEVDAQRSGKPMLREFMAFYTVGYILKQSPEALYKPDSFLRTYHELFPNVPANLSPVYAHAPFEAILFRPFAQLPFKAALVAWQIFSLALICAGFVLVWRSSSSLPPGQLPLALLVALSFEPVSVATILRGQVSAPTFFWLAVAIWCQRGARDLWSGLALALCLTKPTLLVLLLPMLAVGWRLRALMAFIGGAGILGAVSLLVVGWRGCIDYARMVLDFGVGATASGQSFAPASEYVDLNSFLRMIITGERGRVATSAVAVAAAGALLCLARVWRGVPRGGGRQLNLAWASTLTWTMILNLYAAVYDTPIILLGILLMGDVLCRSNQGRLPQTLQILLGCLYVVPWIPPVQIGGGRMVQLYTLVLIALGAYQIWLATAGGADLDQGQPENTSVSRPPCQ
jgi:Glycosyltransferase family 87